MDASDPLAGVFKGDGQAPKPVWTGPHWFERPQFCPVCGAVEVRPDDITERGRFMRYACGLVLEHFELGDPWRVMRDDDRCPNAYDVAVRLAADNAALRAEVALLAELLQHARWHVLVADGAGYGNAKVSAKLVDDIDAALASEAQK